MAGFLAGNMYCQASSSEAFGYFLSIASGTDAPLNFFSNIATLIFAWMMIYYGWLMAALQYRTDQKTIIMQIPLVYLYAILPLMGILWTLRTIQVMYEDIVALKAGKNTNA